MAGQTRSRSGYLLLLSLGALGVVFGDLGTSPLYAFRESFAAAEGLAVDRDSVLGVLSLMTWSLVLVVTVKYLLIVMRADNEGEGGILALTALVTGETKARRSRTRLALLSVGLFGTALLYGDGAITPAISVLSAVEGLEIATPDLPSGVVLGVAVAILVGLFSIQARGTATIGAIFGPVMVVWFLVLAALGIHQIALHPDILAGLSPVHAFRFAFEEPRLAFLALGAIFLVVTGSEALYADMGHFGKGPIRAGWFSLVFPALLLNYFGQGALLIADPAAVESPFYLMAPAWAIWPLLVLATMATVIASQALISGAYSLTTQAVQLGYFPRLGIDHTSPREVGQVYIGTVNWALMVACVTLVVTFRESTNLAAAYGVAVTTTMVITTVLLYSVMRNRWGWSLPLAVTTTVGLLAIDTAFFAANIVKVPEGGWVPLLIGAAIFVVMTTWKQGRTQMLGAQVGRGLTLERFIGSLRAHPQRRVPGTAVYMAANVTGTPPALLSNLRLNEVIHETVVVVTVSTARVPRVQQARRATVHPLGDGFFKVILHVGFFEEPNVPEALATIVHPEFGFDPTDATYVLGRETVLPTAGEGMAAWREHLYALMHRNASGAGRYFRLPPDQVVEVGTQIEI